MSADFLRRIGALEKLVGDQARKIAALELRLKAQEDRRGPGRPPNQPRPAA